MGVHCLWFPSTRIFLLCLIFVSGFLEGQ